jgi:hypothetical protein
MRTTSAAAAGAAATAATLAASATDHGFSGLLIMYHPDIILKAAIIF